KVLVLLTDGNNEPAVPNPLDPEEAALLARDLGGTIHTIAIGQRAGGIGGVDSQTELPFSARVTRPKIPLPERLAETTRGRSVPAQDADALAGVFKTIDALEKSPVRGQILTRYDEHYWPWASIALALLLVDRLLAHGRFRRLP